MAHRPRTYGEQWPRPGEGASVGDALSVLLVEDDDGDALIVDELLTGALPGVRIARSRTFADALDQVDSGMDCVLLDLQLPDARGLDTVARLRARAPQTPLIVLTGLNDEAAGVAAVDAGAQDYLVKGHVDGGQLARAIRYAIARRMAEEAQQQLRLAEAQAREVARLERGLAPRPLLERPVRVDCLAVSRRAQPRAAGRRLLRRHRDAPTAACARSSATSAATGPTKPRSGCACAPRGARSGSRAWTASGRCSRCSVC